MPAEIVLITATHQGPELADELRDHAPGLRVSIVATRAELDAVFAERVARRRLIAFTSDLIVPATAAPTTFIRARRNIPASTRRASRSSKAPSASAPRPTK
jgi:hypothetical protein